MLLKLRVRLFIVSTDFFPKVGPDRFLYLLNPSASPSADDPDAEAYFAARLPLPGSPGKIVAPPPAAFSTTSVRPCNMTELSEAIACCAC